MKAQTEKAESVIERAARIRAEKAQAEHEEARRQENARMGERNRVAGLQDGIRFGLLGAMQREQEIIASLSHNIDQAQRDKLTKELPEVQKDILKRARDVRKFDPDAVTAMGLDSLL